MAKKNINKIKSELEEAKAKVIALEAEQKLAEETLQKEIGKIYTQIQFKKDKNLSYEEVVPRESVFYTGVINSQHIDEFEDFCKKLEENLVQIGANATIGYGFTKFEEVK